MVTSAVDICNLALDFLERAPITSIETPSNATEELMARWYDTTRKQALRKHPWNFATKRIQLAPNATAPNFGYSKQFTLPSDYIRIKYPATSVVVGDSPLPASAYSVEGNSILIGEASTEDTNILNLVYVSDFETVTKMDANFVMFFAALLASNVAYKVTQSNQTVQRMQQLVDKYEAEARSMDGQENPPRRIERSRNRSTRRNTGRVRNYDGYTVFD